jgi:pantothenate kinase
LDDVPGLVSKLLAAVDAQQERFLLGITGPPGSGKSRLAHALVASMLEQRGQGIGVVAPLDGFHLSNAALESLGLLSVKGAPETFDATAFLASLRRLRDDAEAAVSWPDFDRNAEQTVPDAISIGPAAKLVVVEGNYLLLQRPTWREVRELLDQVWYLDVPTELLRRRLIERHMANGRSEADAVRHVDESDLVNAQLVGRTKQLANLAVATTPS